MKMTRVLLYSSISLGLGFLATGWMIASYWLVGLIFLAFLPLCIFLIRKDFRPAMNIFFPLSVTFSAVGIWVGVNISLALMAVVFSLVAWDLEGFSHQLSYASSEDNPQRIERQHIVRLNFLIVLGVGMDLIAQYIRRAISFEWTLILALLAFFSIGLLVNQMSKIKR